MSNNQQTPIKVSILVLTYNQAAYIDDALTGLVDQRTSFPYEIVVGDDCSTDATLARLDDWQRRYPQLVRVLKSPENRGLLPNFIRTFNSCRGEYIAICEGDDYWTNPHKLQVQADFLDSHPSFSTCIHRVVNYYEDNNTKSLSNGGQKAVNTIVDLAKSNFITNVSAMFRSTYVGKLPQWFESVGTYDYALHMLNAQHGDIYYMSKPMAIYRKHAGAIWSRNKASAQLRLSMQVRELLLGHFSEANPQVFNTLFESYLACACALINHLDTDADTDAIISRVQSFKPSLSKSSIMHRCSAAKHTNPSLRQRINVLLKAARATLSKLIPVPKPA